MTNASRVATTALTVTLAAIAIAATLIDASPTSPAVIFIVPPIVVLTLIALCNIAERK